MEGQIELCSATSLKKLLEEALTVGVLRMQWFLNREADPAMSHHMEGGAGPKCRSNTHKAVGIATLAVCSLGLLGQRPAGLPASCPSLSLSLLKAACVAIPCSPLPPPYKRLPTPRHPHPSLQMCRSLTAGGWGLACTQCRAW